jgi:hypothetical protein
MIQMVKYTWMAYKRSYDILNKLKIQPTLAKILTVVFNLLAECKETDCQNYIKKLVQRQSIYFRVTINLNYITLHMRTVVAW